MKNRNEAIAVLNRNIVVEGCTFTHTGLEFAVLDEGSLLRAGACLQEMANCGDWWWGDYLVAYAQFRLEAEHDSKDLAAIDETDQERYRRHYVRNHGSVLNGRELAETQVERYKVAKFYKGGSRLPQLSNEHHRMAMDGSEGDLSVAQEWLDKAAEQGWSRNELRAEMRMAKRGTLSDPPQKVNVTQHELFGAQRWASAQMKRVDNMEDEEVRAMLVDLQPLLALATALARRLPAIELTPSAGATPGSAKESLPLAARQR